MMVRRDEARPRGVTVVAAVNLAAGMLTLAFWLFVRHRLFGPDGLAATFARPALAATVGFMLADLVWAVPVLLVAAAGLWRMTFWGWTAAQLANVLWLYSLTVLAARDHYAGASSPGTLLFLPFVPFAVGSGIYLWRRRAAFMRRPA